MHSDAYDKEWNSDRRRGYYFDNRLQLYNGDSSHTLRKVLASIKERCCFWLDAHSGAQKYARGKVDVPLFEELWAIGEHHIKNHIIAIDDAHLFGKIQKNKTGHVICDYSEVTLEKVTEKIKEINPKYDVGIYAPYEMPMLIAYVIK